MRSRQSLTKIVGIIAVSYATLVAILACSNPSGEFFYGALGLGDQKILVATQNTGSYQVAMYDLNGRLIDVIADYTLANDIPKGIAPFDAFSVAVLLDGVDRISRLSLTGQQVPEIANNSNLTGTLFHLAYDRVLERYYAVEGNTIEAFTKAGARLAGPGVGTPYINTPLGSCAIATARGVAATDDGRLFMVASGNNDLNVYNVSGATATCTTANTTMGATTPVAVIVHSNGLVYVATQGDDRVYSFPNSGAGSGTVVWATNLTYINNPTALLEMPDGTILVASDGTNSIERIDTEGNIVGSTSFIRDGFTGIVTQMMLIGGE